MSRCKLIIQDEVNCKFEGLDPRMKRDLMKAVTLVDPKAKYTPAGRMGRWDGKTYFMQLGGSTFNSLLSDLLPILESNNIEIELEDQRIQHVFDFEHIDENLFSYVEFPPGHHMEGKSIVLREHQVRAVNSAIDNPMGLLLASTSSGKTLISAAMSKVVEKYGRSIVIVPSTDLVQQTYNDYELVGLDVGMFYGERKEFGHTHTITTWQSLNSLWKKTKADEIPLTEQDVNDFIDGCVAVIVDECLDGNTIIKTPLGDKKIMDMKAGDPIYSYDESTGEFIEDEVVKLHTNLTKSNSSKMLEIEMENGEVIRITDNHKVLTTNGWIEAGKLSINDDIISFGEL